jgi:hypothetical protein
MYQIKVLLLGESESATSELLRFMERRGCACFFATPPTAGNLLKSHVFDLVLSVAPLKQADSLIRMLGGTACRIFYRFPVEDSCWWVPLDGETVKSIGRPALRCSEFPASLEQILRDIKEDHTSIAEQLPR